MSGANLTKVEAKERKSVVLAPVEYNVTLDLTTDAKTFVSTTTVAFDAVEGSETFLDLTASEVRYVEINGTSVDPQEAYEDHRVKLTNLQAHNIVRVEAVCDYSSTGEGLHRSVDPVDGNVYLYTQFEVPDARRVYAVFDQPDIKAVFTFSVLAPESWIVTSNMPVASQETVEGASTDPSVLTSGETQAVVSWSFEPTPVMSSYLTAVCAGPYAQWHESYENEDGRTIPMAMYCRQSLRDAFEPDVPYLFDITRKGFAFYAKTWNVPYPYAKYDQIYVPEYNAGAMENIGMVTFRDEYIFESKVPDFKAERRVVTVLHELAHMWFGDYVTMKWWNDLWLNESFAEFTSNLSTAEASDWTNAWATFCSGEKSWALAQDQMPTTHPIVAPIQDLQDTYVNFDGITYAKGASVLKQLVVYVGREQFFEGIHNYLCKYAYANATLTDLLQELEQTAGRNMEQWSKLWLERSGINTLKAQIDLQEDGTIDTVTIMQTPGEGDSVLRPHRLALGLYNPDETGAIVRTSSVQVDIDGERTVIEDFRGKAKPAALLLNDEDLTYAKVRFDDESLKFVCENLYRFDDALARAVIWLSLWDMTRDGELDAEEFIATALKAFTTEPHSTNALYGLRQVETTSRHYVAEDRRQNVLVELAQELWKLARSAKAGSDNQLQLANTYLSFGVPGDEQFASTCARLLDGSLTLEGLSVDNMLRWKLIEAQAAIGVLKDEDIDRYLAQADTTQNREFSYAAKAAKPTLEAKQWAWDQAFDNLDLTNMQLQAVCHGFNRGSQDLATPFVERYFELAESVWKSRSFQIAQVLLEDMYPINADPQYLSNLGHQWLDAHKDADNALRRIMMQNVDATDRMLKVSAYNASLHK